MKLYNHHIGYVHYMTGRAIATILVAVGASGLINNSYSISRRRCKWTYKLFSNLFDITILNSYILLTFCGCKQSHKLPPAREEYGRACGKV